MTPADTDIRAKGRFPTTNWSLVARIRSTDEAVAAKALEDLCTQYHYPLYCYLRRRGCTHHDAQDVLHDFLLRVFRQRTLDQLEENRGHLRGWLSAALGNHFLNWRHSESRREQPIEASEADFESGLDFEAIEARYRSERFADDDTPDRVFEREWVLALLRRVIDGLAVGYDQRGRGALFAILRPILEAGGSLRGEDTSALAAPLGMSPGALRVALARLMREFREALHAEVRLTVEHGDDVREELAYLLSVFRQS